MFEEHIVKPQDQSLPKLDLPVAVEDNAQHLHVSGHSRRIGSARCYPDAAGTR